MKNKGCAFEVKTKEKTSYFVSDSAHGLADFMAHYSEESPYIPDAQEITEAAWTALADDPDEYPYQSTLVLDIPANLLIANEDVGDGLGYYLFPLDTVIAAAKSGTPDLWEWLLNFFPNARKI